MSDDYNIRAAKGQGFNLAVHRATAEGRGDDNRYILTLFIQYYELGQLVQSSSLDDIKASLEEAE